MQEVPQRPISAFVNIEGSACAAALSSIHAINVRHAIDVVATQ